VPAPIDKPTIVVGANAVSFGKRKEAGAVGRHTAKLLAGDDVAGWHDWPDQ